MIDKNTFQLLWLQTRTAYLWTSVFDKAENFQNRVPRGFAVLKLNDLPFNFGGGPVLLSIVRIKPRA
ncbi:hypothetical protein NC651_024400 [Populus alba x Populus x berolinensis]|nr:hypothetical protein NC651_024400 [Populus alba x Populus x berolinensis]